MTFIATLMAALICYAAMSSLSLAMDRHYEQLTQQREVPAERRRLFRIAGWTLLVLSMAACIYIWNTGVGLTVWFALLTMAALAVACGMTYVPRITTRITMAALPLGLLGMGLILAIGL